MNLRISDKNVSIVSILIAASIGGGVSVLIKLALREVPPYSFTFLRFFIASLCILPIFLRSGNKIDAHIYKPILISLLATANVVFFAFGIRLTSATISQTLYTAVPIIAAILSIFLIHEKIHGRKALGIAVGFLGTLAIIFFPLFRHTAAIHSSFIGNVLVFIAVVSFSIYSVISKRLQKTYSPLYLTTIFIITTTVVQFFFALWEYMENPTWIHHVSSGSIAATLFVGVMGTFIYYLLYQYAIKHGGPVIASLTLYLQPVTAFIWASFLLKETLTVEFIIGAILVFTGTAITTLMRK